MTEEHVKAVEKATKGQSESKIWHQQHTGRVTASRLRSASVTSVVKPSPSLIKSMCYPESNKFYSAACRWGCMHEDTACKAYFVKCSEEHDTFDILESGLILSTTYISIYGCIT